MLWEHFSAGKDANIVELSRCGVVRILTKVKSGQQELENGGVVLREIKKVW